MPIRNDPRVALFCAAGFFVLAALCYVFPRAAYPFDRKTPHKIVARHYAAAGVIALVLWAVVR